MPRRMRPKFPEEWHVPNDPRKWVTWAHAESRLKKEDYYWVSTSGRLGRPHAAPVSGIWMDGAFFFETEPTSVKGRNLAANPSVVVHLQSGADVVILEGKSERERNPDVMRRLRAAYVRKYDYTPDWSDETKQVVFRVAPTVALAWTLPRMHRSMVRFVF